MTLLAILCGLAWPAFAAPPGGEELRFVKVAPMTVPLMRGAFVHGNFHLQLVLEVENKAVEREVAFMLPRLEAAYFELLSRLAQIHLEPGRPPDIRLIGDTLQQATDRIAGHGKATVRIQEAAHRR